MTRFIGILDPQDGRQPWEQWDVDWPALVESMPGKPIRLTSVDGPLIGEIKSAHLEPDGRVLYIYEAKDRCPVGHRISFDVALVPQGGVEIAGAVCAPFQGRA